MFIPESRVYFISKQSDLTFPIFHIISKQNHHCLIMIMIHLIWLIEKVDRLDFILWIWNADADVVICVARLLHLCFRPSVLAIRPIKSIQFTPFCCCLLLSAILRAVGARGQFPLPLQILAGIVSKPTPLELQIEGHCQFLFYACKVSNFQNWDIFQIKKQYQLLEDKFRSQELFSFLGLATFFQFKTQTAFSLKIQLVCNKVKHCHLHPLLWCTLPF